MNCRLFCCRYEQRVFELEELEVEMKEKLSMLEEGLKVAEWWATFLMATGQSLKKYFSAIFIFLNYTHDNAN
jgi:hypothetical protein